MAGLEPTAITFVPGIEPFALTPVIEDMVRTRFCVPGSVFLVEGIDAVPVTKTGRWQAIRILLGDGELCVQALLDGALHRFVQTGEVAVGCYVRVQQFELRWRNAAGELVSDAGRDGRNMAYLVLRDLVTTGWNKTVAALYRSEAPSKAVSPDGSEPTGDAEREDTGTPGETKLVKLMKPRQGDVEADETEDADLADAFDTFEALTFPVKKVPPQPAKSRPVQTHRPAAQKPTLPIALPRDWHDPQTPLKLTTLRSIPHLPYAQNWSCNVLVVVATLSPVEPSHLPPYKQRSARIVDPSTTKQVHLTVFLDPDEFAPAVGSAVLLTGVKNHRFDGGSLKKYASDGRGGVRWWFEDPWELTWCDVAGIKQWWADMEAALALRGGEAAQDME
ncbi:Cyclin-like F-box [Hirsutella rhossiliensis]|uniref:Cyclin-like F-box n=1 Tax=Hirsutella rhossiliensis TaxID=111463 RepID=A0A9P8N3J3_9HYPO|nr:Cyclin-like F-box [Hirsutella rhossiliensis]KAH0966240.1 Cyclin-like F-box [Hirsutella rhossiliensis]